VSSLSSKWRTGNGPSIGMVLALLLVLVVHGAIFWPGILTWDAIRQYGQALSGHYDDWHPPAMNWLWRQLRAFGAGPAPMLVLQLALYWCGTLLWLRAAGRGRPRAALAIAVLAVSPVALVLMGTVLKDSLFAGALLLASGLIATARAGERWRRIIAAIVLVAAATLRFNAVPACLPLLVLAAPAAWRRSLPRLAMTSVLAAIPLALALPLANAALHSTRSGVELSLVIYDLGGIGRFSGTNVFPATGVADPVAVNADCYTPVSWDRYAWWGAEPCAIGFTNLHAPLKAGRGPYAWWGAAVLAHPLAYAEHRLAHFNSNTRFLVHDADLPRLSLASDPNPWGFTLAPNVARYAVAAAAQTLLQTPFGWPVCWLALGLGLLVLRPAVRTLDPAAAMAWSAVLYGFSYLPLSVASEVRYHLWTITAVGIAAALTLPRADVRALPRWRWALAGVPLAVVVLGGVVARDL
jgi:hypothetical protein